MRLFTVFRPDLRQERLDEEVGIVTDISALSRILGSKACMFDGVLVGMTSVGTTLEVGFIDGRSPNLLVS